MLTATTFQIDAPTMLVGLARQVRRVGLDKTDECYLAKIIRINRYFKQLSPSMSRLIEFASLDAVSKINAPPQNNK